MRRLLGITVTVLIAAACHNGDPAFVTDPSIVNLPANTFTTQTFTGTVPVGGNDFHTFSVATAAEEVFVTLTSAGPQQSISLGLSIGVPSGSMCSLTGLQIGSPVQTQASSTVQLFGTSPAGGTYCVNVFDIGQDKGPVTYSLTVAVQNPPPPPPMKSDVFAGTIPLDDLGSIIFTVGAGLPFFEYDTGGYAVSIAVTAMGPPATLPALLILGGPDVPTDPSSCVYGGLQGLPPGPLGPVAGGGRGTSYANVHAGTTLSQELPFGIYCLGIQPLFGFQFPNPPGPVTYSITITHP